MIAISPKQIANIKAKGIDVQKFIQWKKICNVQLQRIHIQKLRK